jgi:hypothetical protein
VLKNQVRTCTHNIIILANASELNFDICELPENSPFGDSSSSSAHKNACRPSCKEPVIDVQSFPKLEYFDKF